MPAPPQFAPMLLTTGAPPIGGVVEPKWDGCRSMVTVHEGRVRIRSRNGHDVTDCYPELLSVPAPLAGRSAVFDCEIVAFDESGRCNFQRLQQRMNRHRPPASEIAAVPLVLIVFDLLWLDGEDLTGLRLSQRRARLEGLGLDAAAWQVTGRLEPHITPELLEAYRLVGMEGVVVKGDGPYRPGERARHWVKVKFRRTRLAVIGGLLTERSRYGSLCLGAFHDGELRYIGQVGNSLPRTQADQLEAFLRTLVVDEPAFVDLVPAAMHHLDPLVVVEVSYSEVTAAGTLRQPVLIRVRPDVDAATVELGDIPPRRSPVKVAARQHL